MPNKPSESKAKSPEKMTEKEFVEWRDSLDPSTVFSPYDPKNLEDLERNANRKTKRQDLALYILKVILGNSPCMTHFFVIIQRNALILS